MPIIFLSMKSNFLIEFKYLFNKLYRENTKIPLNKNHLVFNDFFFPDSQVYSINEWLSYIK